MPAWLVDEDGERRRFLVKGFDKSTPEKVIPGTVEIRPGGMMVFHWVNDRPHSVAPPPLVSTPTGEELRGERETRAKENADKERDAAREERLAAEQAARKRAAERKSATA